MTETTAEKTQDLASWFGRMYREHFQAIKGKISEKSSKASHASQTDQLQFLDLRREDGEQLDASWETVSQSPGECLMLNTGESPSVAVESSLSQILQDGQLQKYYLSARACEGILRRAQKRGKDLPPILKKALEKQAGF